MLFNCYKLKQANLLREKRKTTFNSECKFSFEIRKKDRKKRLIKYGKIVNARSLI